MKTPFTEEEARRAVLNAKSWADALRALGYRPIGNNYRTLKKYVGLWGISTGHFTRARRRRHKPPLEEVMVARSTYHRGALKTRLYAEGLKERRCEVCGQGEKWRGRTMSLILDHINGIGDDHRLENLRIVCPNCAATFDTHCGRNVPRVRSCVRCGCEFAPKHLTHRYCSVQCGSGLSGTKTGTHLARPSTRRVHRPIYSNLLLDIGELGYEGTGRRYGVSGNAIRKWVATYERELDAGDFSVA